MEALRTIATLLPLAVTSGINLYATILVAALSIRFGWVQNTPSSLDGLGSWTVIAISGVFYVMEFLADKIPFVDNLWDVAHTFIRPLGAALLAFATLGRANAAVAVIAAMAAGGIALVSHGGKAGSRAALNIVSPAENITNIFVSLAEDIGVGILAYLALSYPYVATGIAAGFLLLIVIYVPRLLRWLAFVFRAVFSRLKGLIRSVDQSDTIPAAHMAALQHNTPELAAFCRAQNIRGANGRPGYLGIVNGDLFFTYDRRFGSRAWRASTERILSAYRKSRTLMDVLEVHYRGRTNRSRVARFVFLKDRLPLVEQLAERLSAVKAA